MIANSPHRAPALLLIGLAVTSLVMAGGCAMCSGTYDCHYAAYGGSRPRGDMIHGRVASAFNDASAPAWDEEIILDPDSQYPIELAPEEDFEPEVLPQVEPIPDTFPTAIRDESAVDDDAYEAIEMAPRLQPTPDDSLNDESSAAPHLSTPHLPTPHSRDPFGVRNGGSRRLHR